MVWMIVRKYSVLCDTARVFGTMLYRKGGFIDENQHTPIRQVSTIYPLLPPNLWESCHCCAEAQKGSVMIAQETQDMEMSDHRQPLERWPLNEAALCY